MPSSVSPGEEHSSKPHLQDREGAPRAWLLSKALQPGRLCGTIPEVPTAPLQLATFRPSVTPNPGLASDDGPWPDAPHALLRTLSGLACKVVLKNHTAAVATLAVKVNMFWNEILHLIVTLVCLDVARYQSISHHVKQKCTPTSCDVLVKIHWNIEIWLQLNLQGQWKHLPQNAR